MSPSIGSQDDVESYFWAAVNGRSRPTGRTSDTKHPICRWAKGLHRIGNLNFAGHALADAPGIQRPFAPTASFATQPPDHQTTRPAAHRRPAPRRPETPGTPGARHSSPGARNPSTPHPAPGTPPPDPASGIRHPIRNLTQAPSAISDREYGQRVGAATTGTPHHSPAPVTRHYIPALLPRRPSPHPGARRPSPVAGRSTPRYTVQRDTSVAYPLS